MLGEGTYHQSIPRSLHGNLLFRRRVLRACREDRSLREAAIEACKRDVLFFINQFVWQYNPLMKGAWSVGPFVTWPFQEKTLLMTPPVGRGVLWCYEHNRTAVVEKSRDMGASWLFLIVQDWLCLFHNHIQTLNISRSADAVDSASRNSLFQKVRFMHEHLPDWLKGEIDESKFNFKYRRTGSEATGEASTGRAGTGGRASVVFVDEFSEIKEDVKVRQNTASIADCRFFNGTHLGVGTEFFNLTKSPECVQIQMHWTRHPRKNAQMYSFDVDTGTLKYWRYDSQTDSLVQTPYPLVPFPEDYDFDRSGNPSGGPHPGIRSVWYDKKAGEIGTVRQVAMELDINPTGSSSQFYEPLVIRKLQESCRTPVWSGYLEFDEQRAIPRRLVPSEGPLNLWIDPGVATTGEIARVPPGRYVIGVDPSTGSGATPSCMTIFDSGRGVKVGAWVHNRTDPKSLAWIAVSLCRLFRDAVDEPAYLIWELNGTGITFGHEVLKEIGYRKIYWKRDVYGDEAAETQTPGFYSSPSTKKDMHTQYAAALKAGLFVNYDRDSLEETLSYAHANGTVEHPRAKSSTDAASEGVNHGDRVVADALSWWAGRRFAKLAGGEEEPTVLALPNSIAGRRLIHKERERRLLKWG